MQNFDEVKNINEIQLRANKKVIFSKEPLSAYELNFTYSTI